MKEVDVGIVKREPKAGRDIGRNKASGTDSERNKTPKFTKVRQVCFFTSARSGDKNKELT